MIVGPHIPGLPNGVTARESDRVLICILYLFFRNETYMAGQMTKKSICSEPVFAAAHAHSVCGFGPIGEGMAADVYRADAQPDITVRVL